jgi:hypothetical protein
MNAVYLDTAILVKLLVREPDSDYAGLVDGQPSGHHSLCSSSVFRL